MINLLSDRVWFLATFLACVASNRLTLLPPSQQAGAVKQLFSRYPDSMVVDNKTWPSAKFSELLAAISNATVQAPGIPDDQPAAVLFTSGSTGKPSAHAKPWRTLRDGALQDARLLQLTGETRLNLVATVPPQHMWGFETTVLLPIFTAATSTHHHPFFPADIQRVLEQTPAPRALVSSPVHLRALYRSGVDLPPLEFIYTATAALDGDLAKALERRYQTSVVEIFGSSETGMLAHRAVREDEQWHAGDSFSLAAQTDCLMVSAPHLPEPVSISDHVQMTGQGTFLWLGRDADMVNIAGKRGSLAHLNALLLQVEGVEDGVVFSSEKRLAALVVAPHLDAAAIRSALAVEVDPVLLPRPVVLVESLPRQPSGKLAANDVLALFKRVRAVKR